MTKATIDPGVCGLITVAEAVSLDGLDVTLHVKSGCGAINAMLKELGNSFDSYELCLAKPGCGPLYEYAAAHFPGHCACPAIAGIIKAAEAECRLALPKDASIVLEIQ
ncbi:MAG: hypothetical protein RR825_02595 [Ruthenibacterium sp.]